MYFLRLLLGFFSLPFVSKSLTYDVPKCIIFTLFVVTEFLESEN